MNSQEIKIKTKFEILSNKTKPNIWDDIRTHQKMMYMAHELELHHLVVKLNDRVLEKFKDSKRVM